MKINNLKKEALKKNARYLMPAVLAVLFVLTSCNLTSVGQNAEKKELMIYVGGCIKGAVSEISEKFKAENPGLSIKIVAKGSGPLLDNIGEWRTGDIYIPGDRSFAEQAIDLDYMEDYTPVSYHAIGLIVPRGNPLGIRSIEDITPDDIRISIGIDNIAMGRMLRTALENTSLFEEIKDNYIFIEESRCIRIPNAVAENHIDAGISCKPSALRQGGDVEFISIPELDKNQFIIPIGILKFSESKELAERFTAFVLKDENKAIFEKHGFDPIRKGGK